MAMVFEGFSIREYASKMRSVDVEKCWPFADEDGNRKISTETIHSLLPSITVTKFRWWSHEFDLTKAGTQEDGAEFAAVEAEKSVEDEVNKSEMRGVVLTAVDHVGNQERCLGDVRRSKMRAMVSSSSHSLKPKSRPPKKRSIVEIFAVAPQIHKVPDVDFDDGESSAQEEEEFDSNGSRSVEVMKLKGRNKKRKKTNKEKKKAVAVVKLQKKRNKKKKHREESEVKEPLAKKENLHKLTPQAEVNFAKKLDGSICSNRIADISNKLVRMCKKPDLQFRSSKKKAKAVQSSKLKRKKLVGPVCSILKNNRECFPKKKAAARSVENAYQVNEFCNQNPDKHVNFLERNDIVRPKSKHISSFDQSVCSLHSDALASKEKNQSVASGKNIGAIASNGIADDACVSKEKGDKFPSEFSEEQIPNACKHAEIPHFLKPHSSYQGRARHLLNENMNMVDDSSRIGSLHHSYAFPPRIITAMEEVHNPSLSSQRSAAVSRPSNFSDQMNEFLIDNIHASSKANTQGYPQLTSFGFSSNGTANNSVPFLLQPAVEDIRPHASHYEPFCCRPPTEMMGSLLPFSDWTERAVGMREKHMDVGFLGLPLNSQGELVQANSIRKERFNQVENSSFTTSSSSGLLVNNSPLPRSMVSFCNVKEKHIREVPQNQIFFPEQNCSRKEKPGMYLPARLGVNEAFSEKADVNWVHHEKCSNQSFSLLDSNLSLVTNSMDNCKQHFQIRNYAGNNTGNAKDNTAHMSLNNAQPTMRLMGKDVAIGRTSTEMQNCYDRRVWAYKDTVTEHQPINYTTDRSSVKGHFQEWLHDPQQLQPKEIPIQIQPFENQALQRTYLMRAPETRFSHPHPNWHTQAVYHNENRINNGRTNHWLHRYGSPPTTPAVFNNEAETVRVGTKQPISSAPRITCQHMDYSPAELRYNQNLPQAAKSSFNFPFLHPDCSTEHVQSLWFQSSTNSMVPWLLHASQQVKTNFTPQNLSDMGDKYHTQTPHTAGTQLASTPSVQLSTSPVIYPHNSMTSHSHPESSIGSLSVIESPIKSILHGVKPTPTISISNRNRSKVQDRMKSKAFNVNDSGYWRKTSKRPADKLDCSPRPTKTCNLGTQNDSGFLTTGSTTENGSNSMQYKGGSMHASSVELPCYNIVDGSRPGPVKLVAGAKHILKPSHDMDQDNSKLIHSTIPFVLGTDYGSAAEPREKSSNVYRM